MQIFLDIFATHHKQTNDIWTVLKSGLVINLHALKDYTKSSTSSNNKKD